MNLTYPLFHKLALAYGLLAWCCCSLAAQPLYWSELIPGGGPGGSSAASLIKRADIDGQNAQTILGMPAVHLEFIHTLEYEANGQKIYWTDRNKGLIQRANLDGSNLQTVVTRTYFGQPSSLRGLALDSQNSSMFWVDASPTEAIVKSGLDGSNPTNLVNNVRSGSIALNTAGAQLFFENNAPGGGPQGPVNTLDVVQLDGSNRHSVATGIVQFGSVDIDVTAQKLYWVDLGYNSLNDTTLFRSNLDGTGVETLLSNMADIILDLEIDPARNSIFWTSRDEGMVKRADLNGQNLTVLASGLSRPHVITTIPEPSSWLLVLGGGLLLILRFRRSTPTRVPVG